MKPDAALAFEPDRPTDLRLTLAPLRRSSLNPAVRYAPDGVWRATQTPAGVATQHLWQLGRTIHVEAWGPGAEWLVAAAPALCGGDDDDEGFVSHHRLVSELRHRLPGMRMPRSGSVLEALVATVLEQKVSGMEAWLAYRRLVWSLGEPAPGPFRLQAPPDAGRLASTPYFVYHRFGIERRRADVIRHIASRAVRVEECAALSPAEARRRLLAFPGVGAWSAAEVARAALGDADAVSVGDYNLPHMVSWAFAGERRGTDARMLELLEPYNGHRGRVLRYLEASGIGPSRRGPRMPLRNVAAM